MDSVDPYESIGFHCSLTYRAFAKVLEDRLHGMGIKPSQFLALSHLTALGPMSQGELASFLSSSSVTVVKLIDRMERDGWVVRKQSEEDRRIKLLYLTRKANKQWRDLTAIARSVIQQAHKGITEDEIDTLKKLLKKIRNNLS